MVPLGKLSRTYRGTSIATYVLYRVADPIGPVLRHSSMREHPPQMAFGALCASGENYDGR